MRKSEKREKLNKRDKEKDTKLLDFGTSKSMNLNPIKITLGYNLKRLEFLPNNVSTNRTRLLAADFVTQY